MELLNRLALVTKRENYGNLVYYPANETARLATDLAGTRTLTDRAIRLLKDYGFTVQVVAEPETLQTRTKLKLEYTKMNTSIISFTAEQFADLLLNVITIEDLEPETEPTPDNEQSKTTTQFPLMI